MKVLFHVRHDGRHDGLSEPTPLVLWIDSYVHDLKEAASISDQTSHSDGGALVNNECGKDSPLQPLVRGGLRKRA